MTPDTDPPVDTESTTASSPTLHQNRTSYERWVRRLYQTNLFHPVKLGLDNINRLYQAIGQPLDQPNRVVIHIAGTNGKGSVAYKIAHVLQRTHPHLKIGLFTSPHVSSFRERMQIVPQQYISEEDVVDILPHLYEICQTQNIPATFFELTTALAFAWFDRQDANVVVLETGLGGRLDATNIVQNPALCIITSIGLEHTRILGDTVELIAVEKAGIMKRNCPVLVGPNVPHATLRQCAKEKNVSRYWTYSQILSNGNDTDVEEKEMTTPFDDYDEENGQIAKAALTLLHKSHAHVFSHLEPNVLSNYLDIASVSSSLTSIRPPCRFEIVKQFENEGNLDVILDVAHNPPAMKYLLQKIDKVYSQEEINIRVVVGMSSDKDLGLCSRMLLERLVHRDEDVSSNNDTLKEQDRPIYLVQAQHPRAATMDAILEAEPQMRQYSFHDDGNITRQVHRALAAAQVDARNNVDGRKQIVIVCGSVFLMAEAREALGYDEPQDSDYIAEVAGANLRHGQEVFGNTTIKT